MITKLMSHLSNQSVKTKLAQLLTGLLFSFSMSVQSATLVGTTKGELSVDQGVANFTVPIKVPAGVAGMTPNISLNYASNAGNGLMGIGWSVGGLSSITRCPSNLSQDGKIRGVRYDAEDKLCLDGQRLIVVGGVYGTASTEYRTETDTFSKITSHGWNGTGPDWFEVQSKGGQTVQFGNSESSRQYDSGNTVVHTWAVNEFKDTAGNVIEVIYDRVDGEYLPWTISYAGDLTASNKNKVVFNYQERTDTSRMFQAGQLLIMKHRLKDVRVEINGSLYKSYEVDYKPETDTETGSLDQSLVASVTECAFGGDCFPAFDFGWIAANVEEGSEQFVFGGSVSTEPEYDSSSVDVSRTMLGDFDGDERTDFYVAGGDISLSDGYFHAYLRFESSEGPGFDVGSSDSDVSLNTSRIKMGDFNGDRLTDFYHINGKDGFEERDKIHLSNADGSYTIVNGLLSYVGRGVQGSNNRVNNEIAAKDISRIKFGDFDGDGRTDIYYVRGEFGGETDGIYLSNGNGTFRFIDGITPPDDSAFYNSTLNVDRTQFADFDGDGMTDIYFIRGWNGELQDLIYLSNGDGTYRVVDGINVPVGNNKANAKVDFSRIKFGDFNGDGKTDIYQVKGRNNTSSNDTIHLSKGDGSYESIGALSTYKGSSLDQIKRDIARIMIADFNGDGKSDIYYVTGSSSSEETDKIYLSYGDGRFESVDGANTAISSNAVTALTDISRIKPGDFNGDGLLDIFYLKKDVTDTLWLNRDRQPRIYDFTNGLNVKTILGYSHLRDIVHPSSTQLNIASVYPFVDFAGSQLVVRHESHDGGSGPRISIHHRYGNATVHARGRGHQGFSWVESHNMATKRIVRIQRGYDDRYDDAFPFTSSFVQSTEYIDTRDLPPFAISTPPETALSPVSDSFTWTNYVSNQAGVYAARIDNSVEQMFDDNGELLKTITTEHLDYDDYGNVGETAVVTDGGGKRFQNITRNQYYNDTGNWILGRLSSSEVTHIDENDEVISKNSEFQYRADTGWLSQEIINPGTPLALTKDYLYDAFGNQIQVTSSGATNADGTGWQERIAARVYDSNGRYLEEKYNTKGLLESFEYLERCGVPEVHTDWNGLKTTWEYNNACQKTKEIRPDGTTTEWFVEWANEPTLPDATILSRVTKTGQPDELVYTNKFGKTIRTVKIGFDGQRILQDVQYDGLARQTHNSLPYFDGNSIFWVETSFDDFGRIKEINTPAPHSTNATIVTSYEYDDFNITETLADGTRKTSIKNVIDQVERIEEEEGAWIEYDYNPVGALIETNANGIITTLEYDEYGHKSKMIDPSMGTWTYGYNAFGEMKWQTDAKGQTVTMDYDVMGRMVSRTEVEGVTNWVYDIGNKAQGKLYEVNSPGGYKEVYSYDDLGRPEYKTVTAGVEGTFVVRTEYDTIFPNRVKAVTYPSGLRLTNVYNDLGFLESVQGITAQGNVKFWEVKDSDASGRLTEALYGNGLTTTYNYDTGSGLLDRITTSSATAGDIRNLEYRYDNMYNVEWRKDHHQDRQEDFVYDDLQRLTKSTTTGTFNSSAYNHVTDFAYDTKGNMTYNSDVGSYTYGNTARSTGLAGPFAMLSAGSSMTGYTYDANGNAKTSNGRTITWNSYNKPIAFVKDGKTTQFSYGANRSRYLKVNDTTRTVYIGKSYERVTSGNEIKHKNFIYAGGKVVAIHETSTKANVAQPEKTNYLHTDNLGSTDTITNSAGVVVERMGYAAFGERRLSDWRVASTSIIPEFTNRGYTGHEHIDEVGLIHMNGRVYDPKAGRFLSADLHVQDGKSSQSYNRYSYVMNNPMKYTDPSGFFWKKVKKAFKKAIKKVFKATMYITGLDAAYNYVKKNPWAQTVLMVAAGATGQVWLSAVASAAFSKMNGGSWGDALKAGAMVLATAGLASEVAAVAKGAKMGLAASAALHGVSQGAFAEATGGDFRSSFVGGFAGHYVSGSMQATNDGSWMDINGNPNPGAIAGRTAVAAVAGGTASYLGGGKFKNGAVTAAFVHMYNAEAIDPFEAIDWLSERCSSPCENPYDVGPTVTGGGTAEEFENARQNYRQYQREQLHEMTVGGELSYAEKAAVFIVDQVGKGLLGGRLPNPMKDLNLPPGTSPGPIFDPSRPETNYGRGIELQ